MDGIKFVGHFFDQPIQKHFPILVLSADCNCMNINDLVQRTQFSINGNYQENCKYFYFSQ